MEEADRDIWWPRWVWVGKCFFWYRLTQVVPDKIQSRKTVVCVCVPVIVQYKYYTVSQKNTDVARYNFNAHKPILVIFGRDVAESMLLSGDLLSRFS